MKSILITLVLVVLYVKANDPEASLKTVEELVTYHGYPIETHDVLTDDDYILTLHRIPHDKINTTTSGKRKVIILQHGVLCNSGYWISNIPKNNLPYLLVERGYDVFLPNLRGNNLSRRHKTLSPDRKAFWNFTFNDVAKYDLPAIFKLVLELSGAETFTYIGHSMGTTVMFVFLSKNPQYNKVTSFHAMAPVVQLKHSRSPLMQMLFTFANSVYSLLNVFGQDEFLPHSTHSSILSRIFCTWAPNILCSNMIFFVMGYDNEQFNDTRLPVYMNFLPAGTSTKNMYHYAQIAKAGKFQEYDYGRRSNRIMYNQDTPPLYDVDKITTDIYLYSGLSDWMADPEDVKWLDANLKTLIEHYVVNFTKFNHVDFAWAEDVVPLLFEKLIPNVDKSSV